MERLLEWAAILTLAMGVLVQLPTWFPIESQPPSPTVEDGWQAVAIPVLGRSKGPAIAAGRLRLRFRHDGHEWLETLTTIVLVLPMDAGVPLAGVEAASNAASQATFVVFHAPGVVEPDAERIRLSLRFNADWLAYRDRSEAIRRCTRLGMECPRMPRPTAAAAKDATGGR